jgi:hypothetical protein
MSTQPLEPSAHVLAGPGFRMAEGGNGIDRQGFTAQVGDEVRVALKGVGTLPGAVTRLGDGGAGISLSVPSEQLSAFIRMVYSTPHIEVVQRGRLLDVVLGLCGRLVPR